MCCLRLQENTGLAPTSSAIASIRNEWLAKGMTGVADSPEAEGWREEDEGWAE